MLHTQLTVKLIHTSKCKLYIYSWYIYTAAAEGAHGTHWAVERAVAAGLYAVIPAAYVMEPSFAMDTALSTFLVLHAHWYVLMNLLTLYIRSDSLFFEVHFKKAVGSYVGYWTFKNHDARLRTRTFVVWSTVLLTCCYGDVGNKMPQLHTQR